MSAKTINGTILGLPDGCVVTLQFKVNSAPIGAPFQVTISGGIGIVTQARPTDVGNFIYGFDVLALSCAGCTMPNVTISHVDTCP